MLSERKVRTAPCIAGCGRQVPYKTNAKVVCDACFGERKRAKDRRAAEKIRRKRGVAVVKGTEFACLKCDAIFIRSGIKRKYCLRCAAEIAAERARRNSREKSATPEGRQYLNQWFKERLRVDPAWRVSRHMRTLMHRGLRSNKQGKSWRSFVDYSLEELMRHLERQFTPGMSWEKMGSEIHIDHIQPLVSFSFTTADDPEFKAAWALSNLRPLWSKDNHEKNARRTHLL